MNPKTECEHTLNCPEPLDVTLRDIRATLYNLRKRALLNPTEQNVRELKAYTRMIKEALDL